MTSLGTNHQDKREHIYGYRKTQQTNVHLIQSDIEKEKFLSDYIL